MKFLQDNEILDSIKSMVRNRASMNETLNIAVAFWGKKALEETGLAERAKRNPDAIRVICDLHSGACNPQPIRQLIKFGVEVKDLPKMHAKIWMLKDNVIIGSANVSANGLGGFDRSTQGNFEVAVQLKSQQIATSAQQWFESHWERSDCITMEQLDIATVNWENRIRLNGTGDKNARKKSFLTHVERQTKLTNEIKNVKILVWEEDSEWTPKRVEEERNRLVNSKQAQSEFSQTQWDNERGRDSWLCWHKNWRPKMDDICIEYVYRNRGDTGRLTHLRFEGVWRIVSNKYIEIANGNKPGYVLLRYNQDLDCNGFVLTTANQRALKTNIRKYINSKNIQEFDKRNDSNLIYMNIKSFLDQVKTTDSND